MLKPGGVGAAALLGADTAALGHDRIKISNHVVLLDTIKLLIEIGIHMALTNN